MRRSPRPRIYVQRRTFVRQSRRLPAALHPFHDLSCMRRQTRIAITESCTLTRPVGPFFTSCTDAASRLGTSSRDSPTAASSTTAFRVCEVVAVSEVVCWSAKLIGRVVAPLWSGESRNARLTRLARNVFAYLQQVGWCEYGRLLRGECDSQLGQDVYAGCSAVSVRCVNTTETYVVS